MEMFLLSDFEIVLVSILGFFFLIQLIYYLFLYGKIHGRTKALKKNKIQFETEFKPVSVVIYARNESTNLRKNLPQIMEQDYPEFEVVVVSEGSTEESEEVLAYMERTYPHFYHTFIPEGSRSISREKLALTMGIKASKYDWIVLTEPDCYPAGKNWLKSMARNFTPDTEIVLGYSGYEQKKGWRFRKIAFDNFFKSIRYLSFALARKPYMGIGRNMAYRKELFFNIKGFSNHLNLKRGEDDLFINQIATSKNTRVETDAEAKVWIQPVEYYKIWKEEKVNYIVTSRLFKGIQRYLLGFETMSRLLFYTFFIGVIIKAVLASHWFLLGIAVLVYILRFIFQAIVVNKTADDLSEQKSYLTLPIFDLLLPFYSLRFKLLYRFRQKSEFRTKC